MTREEYKDKLIQSGIAKGKVRGLLCHNCNRALGLLKDSTEYLENCINYLKRVTTIPKGSTLK